MKIISKIITGLFLVVIIGFGVWMWGSLTFVFSTGERSGFVQKISKRGWLFKTWEGELAMVNLPGAMPEKFEFSVRKDDVAHEIERSLGQRVVLRYEQHRGIPTTAFGETEYFVTEIRPVIDSTATAITQFKK